MPVANLRVRIISRWEGENADSARRVREGQVELNLSFGRIGRSLGRSITTQRFWIKMGVVLAPAMFTLGKHLLGLAAGLGVMGAVVTAAALPWVALAFTATRNLSEMGSAGTRYAAGLARVESAWMELARSTASLTLGPVTDVLNGIAAAIPKLEPLVRQVAPDFARMGKDIQAWLSGRGFERFLQNIQDYGVPAFRNLVAAGRDFLATVGIGFRHFLPLARDIADTLRRGAADMRSAAQGGGIARWLREWRTNAPVANRFLREAANSLRIMVNLLDDLGTPTLSAVNTGLSALNAVNPHTALALVLAWTSGKAILGLAAALAMLRAMRALRALSFVSTVAALATSAGALTAAAAALTAMATSINNLARMVSVSVRIRVNSSALDNIKRIWDSVPKNGSATFNGSGFGIAVVAVAGVASTMAAVRSVLAHVATFQARVDATLFSGVMGIVLVAWAAVRAVGLAAPVFTAAAIANTLAINGIIVTWSRVRAIASIPVIFSAVGNPGPVSTVAFSIISAWARVRAASIPPPVFIALATPGNVISGARQIVSAWRRVTSMPKSWSATARVNAGSVPGTCSRIVAAWRSLYTKARSWSGVATCSFSGGFSGYGIPTGHVIGGGQPLQGGYGPLPGNILSKLDDDFGSVDFGDVYVTGPGDLAPFEGGFGNAKGGPMGYSTIDSRTLGGGKGRGARDIYIYDDIWVRDAHELAEVLEDAITGR